MAESAGQSKLQSGRRPSPEVQSVDHPAPPGRHQGKAHRPLLLTGEYELSLDEKKRLSIPARLREQIDTEEYGTGFYVVLGAGRILSLYPDGYYQRIALAVAPRKAAPDELLAYERVNYALAGKVELDRQGRVLLGDKALRRARLRDQVTLIGARDHLELWDPNEWEAYLEEHLPAQQQMTLEAREALLRREQKQAGW